MGRKSKLTDEEKKKRKAEYQKKNRWDHNHWEDRLWRGAKSSAKLRNIPFEINKEDIKIPSNCPILGVPLLTGNSPEYHPKHDFMASLDRKDPTKGYTKDNIWVISWIANRMKQDVGRETLRIFSSSILFLINEGVL